MIKQFRFHFNDFFKDLTLTPDNDWQRDELEEFLENLDTEYPSFLYSRNNCNVTVHGGYRN